MLDEVAFYVVCGIQHYALTTQFAVNLPIKTHRAQYFLAGETSGVAIAFRKNTDKKYDEGKNHITQAMREMAREANAVDEELHQFVSAKFCYRLNEVGLLKHPLVLEELESFEPIYER